MIGIKFWLPPTPATVTTADAALAYALDRLVPNAEAHELEHVRDRLRERGFDVLAVIREVR